MIRRGNMKYLNIIKSYLADPEAKEAGKLISKQLAKGIIFGMGLPIGTILAFHVFWVVGQVLVTMGLQQ